MIELKHLGKTYETSSGSVTALRDIDLTIQDGEIFGVIGLSGAGKSTLVRCINLLERPTQGEVWILSLIHIYVTLLLVALWIGAGAIPLKKRGNRACHLGWKRVQ